MESYAQLFSLAELSQAGKIIQKKSRNSFHVCCYGNILLHKEKYGFTGCLRSLVFCRAPSITGNKSCTRLSGATSAVLWVGEHFEFHLLLS